MTVAESKLVSENIANNIAAQLIRLFVFMAGFSQIFGGGWHDSVWARIGNSKLILSNIRSGIPFSAVANFGYPKRKLKSLFFFDWHVL
jgi:hypothetical protein